MTGRIILMGMVFLAVMTSAVFGNPHGKTTVAAAALLSKGTPKPTATPKSTHTPKPTPTPKSTATPKPTRTPAPVTVTNTPTSTPTDTSTNTPTSMPTDTSTPTSTPISDGLIGTTLVGNTDADCVANTISFNVSVQVTQPGYDTPIGTFYLQYVDGPSAGSIIQRSGQGTSASLALSLDAFSTPTTVHVRALFVPVPTRTGTGGTTAAQFKVLDYRPSQVIYEISIPGGASCASATPMPATSLTGSYLQIWPPYLDIACEPDAIFSAQAFTLPPSTTPSGSIIFDCSNGQCPVEFFIPQINIIHATSKVGMSIPMGEFQPGGLFITHTFIPDDPNLLPTSIEFAINVQSSTAGCPTDVVLWTNGPPPTP